MSSAIEIYDATGATALNTRISHTTGTPVSSAVLDRDGRAFADEFTLTLSAVNVAGTPNTGTVTITAASGKGPWNNYVQAVNLDNTTVYRFFGCSIKFNDSETAANGWASVVKVGVYGGLLRAGNPTGTRMSWSAGIASPGTVSVAAGASGFYGKFIANNVSAETLTDSKLIYRPNSILVDTGGTAKAFLSILSQTDEMDESVTSNQLQPYNISFTGDTGSLINVLVEGSSAQTVQDLESGDPLANSLALKKDGVNRYQFTSGPLEGVLFILATTAVNTSTENIIVTANTRHMWFALDSGGAPGTFVQDEIILTQSGQGSGILQPAGTCAFWLEIKPVATSSNQFNPYQMHLNAEYARTGEANWTGA